MGNCLPLLSYSTPLASLTITRTAFPHSFSAACSAWVRLEVSTKYAFPALRCICSFLKLRPPLELRILIRSRGVTEVTGMKPAAQGQETDSPTCPTLPESLLSGWTSLDAPSLSNFGKPQFPEQLVEGFSHTRKSSLPESPKQSVWDWVLGYYQGKVSQLFISTHAHSYQSDWNLIHIVRFHKHHSQGHFQWVGQLNKGT